MDDTLIGRSELSNVNSIAPSSTISISTVTSYAELHTTQALNTDSVSSMTQSVGYHANYACNNELDSTAMVNGICVKEKATSANSVVVVDQNEEEEEASDNEATGQRIVSSAFVDLINIVSSNEMNARNYLFVFRYRPRLKCKCALETVERKHSMMLALLNRVISPTWTPN